jgi:PAS domain S-box-containing protein
VAVTPPGEDLVATVRRMRTQQEAISAAGRSDAFVAGDVEQLTREITELAAKAVGVERASVWLFKGDERKLRCVDLYEATPGRHSEGAVVSEAQYRTEFLALQKACFVDADDPLTDPRTSGYVEDYLLPLRITSLLDAVIEVSGHRLGLLCLEHVLKPHHWERDEVDFACQFADKIALSLVNRARRDAQGTLRASEVRYRRLFESAMDGILILDAETAVIVDVNPFLAELIGYPREEILGRRIWDLGFFRDMVASEADFQELVEKGYTRYDDRALKARNGRRIDVEFVGNVYLVNQKRVVQCNIRDITEHKRADEGLRKLSRIVEQAPLSVAIADLSGTLEYVNPTFCEVSGYASEEVIGQNANLLSSGGAPPEVYADMWQTLTSGRVWRGEFENRRKSGEIYVELAVIAPVVGPDGRPTHYVALKEDITKRKEAEAALDASLQEKKALLREIHHRVKNNLQVITSLLRLEAGRSGDEGTRLVLKDMQGRIMSMALLHETLYRTGDFGRVELATYLRQLSQQLFRAHGLGAGQARLVLDLAPVQADIDQAIPCGLIVNEMLTNSLKHGFAGGQDGEVRVVLRPQADDHVYLEVSDSGVGLPADFEARRGGSLGMQLITDLARQIGGRLDIGPGPGAHFSVVFSRVRHPTGETVRPGTTPE